MTRKKRAHVGAGISGHEMSLNSHVNNSGFPLQLAIANKVRTEATDWNVLYEEHEWNSKSGAGFLDFVIEDKYKTWLMNIECKRVRDTNWIFLMDRQATPTRRVAKLWVNHWDSKSVIDIFDWVDIPMDPPSPQSAYCVVPGQDPKAKPMLERTAANLVQSTEALAREETLILTDNYSGLRIYQNVIVTTALLQVCFIDIQSINIETGEIPEESSFQEVPYVRLRKQLGASISNVQRVQHSSDIVNYLSRKESTVFVVNSGHFLQFLSDCELTDDIEKHIKGAH